MNKLLSIALCAGLVSGIAFARGGYGHGNHPSSAATVAQSTTATTATTTSGTTLSEEMINDLVFMYQEEKMARDVYATLAEMWGANIFYNIQSAEQKHMDAVRTLLDAYNIPVPVIEDTRGVFENAEIQALYDELVDMGSESLISAYNVGVTIEETDIVDLESRLTDVPSDIAAVYENLLSGSYNHLRAFNRVLDRM